MLLKVPPLSCIRFVAIAALIMATLGCSRQPQEQILISLPPDFRGQVHIEMGVPGAPALTRQGRNYEIQVPPDGKVVTSTVITAGTPQFRNAQIGHVWGYTPKLSKTGDDFPVGGTIEFFVGTREQYESAEAKKHKSKLYPDVSRQSPHRS
jgi:hypothetical protein